MTLWEIVSEMAVYTCKGVVDLLISLTAKGVLEGELGDDQWTVLVGIEYYVNVLVCKHRSG